LSHDIGGGGVGHRADVVGWRRATRRHIADASVGDALAKESDIIRSRSTHTQSRGMHTWAAGCGRMSNAFKSGPQVVSTVAISVLLAHNRAIGPGNVHFRLSNEKVRGQSRCHRGRGRRRPRSARRGATWEPAVCHCGSGISAAVVKAPHSRHKRGRAVLHPHCLSVSRWRPRWRLCRRLRQCLGRYVPGQQQGRASANCGRPVNSPFRPPSTPASPHTRLPDRRRERRPSTARPRLRRRPAPPPSDLQSTVAVSPSEGAPTPAFFPSLSLAAPKTGVCRLRVIPSPSPSDAPSAPPRHTAAFQSPPPASRSRYSPRPSVPQTQPDRAAR